MTPLRILVLENEPSSKRGGQEHSLLDVCLSLARAGHQLTLGYHTSGDLLERYARAGIRTVVLEPFAIDRRRPLASAGSWLRGFTRAIGEPADVIYINQYHDVLFAGALARMRRLPLVCHLRLMPPTTYCGQWRVGLPHVSRFIASSHAVRNACLSQGYEPASIDVVYNGIDLDRFQPTDDRLVTRRALGLPASAFVAIYAGRIDPPKDLERMLRALAALRSRGVDARLLVVGSPVNFDTVEQGTAYLASLRSLADSLGVAGAVSWLGRRQDLPALYTASDVALLLSKEPESFGRMLVEGMACEIPSVGREGGGVAEVLTGEFARFLLFEGGAERTAELLGTLVGWRERDPTLGSRARQHVVQRFDATRMGLEVEQVLVTSVAEGPLRRGPDASRLKRVAAPAIVPAGSGLAAAAGQIIDQYPRT